VTSLLYIGIGGFLGANARYLLTVWLTQQIANRIGTSYPLGTLVVNVSGSLLLAFFLTWTAHQFAISENLRLLVGTGFFGAYTTFSTFANESIALFRTEHWGVALVNIIGTNLLCLGGVLLGMLLAHRLLNL
jgi:CrcB protein